MTRDDLIENFRSHTGTGSKYAVAIGLIEAIAKPAKYGAYGHLTAEQRLAEIVDVLDSLSAAVEEN